MAGTTATLGLPYPTDGDLVQLVDESIQSLAEAVEATLLGSAGGWQNLTLAANTAALAGAWGTPRARLLAGGLVVSTGLVNNTVNPLATGLLIATLPVGLRPSVPLRRSTQVASSGGGLQVGVVTIGTDGTIRHENFAAAGQNLATSLSFEFSTL